MRCFTCHGSGVHVSTASESKRINFKNLAQSASISKGLPFSVFTPEREACRDCGGTGKIRSPQIAEVTDKETEDLEYLGTVVAYHSGKCTASLLLDRSLYSGEKIVVSEGGGDLEIEVEWMQWGKAWVHLALRGWMVTIPAPGHVKTGSRVYRAA